MEWNNMITFIANNANNGLVSDGGRIKIRLYKDLLIKEGYKVNIIELDGWKKRVFNIIFQIKKAIKNRDRIVIMAGPKGCRKIIPLLNFLNKKNKSKIVFCPLGIGTVDCLIKNMNNEDAQKFIKGEKEIKNKDLKMGKMLLKMERVVLENNTLLERYKSFYHINNACVLENFRNYKIIKKHYSDENGLNIIYASRVKEYKGIFDLIDAVKSINKKYNYSIKLDIYGDNQLSEGNNVRFEASLDKNISYLGTIESDKMLSVIKKYDLFCLPTKYYGEGTSGSLIESLIAGTPVLVSSYSQANELIHDGVDGFLYDFNSTEDLKRKIIMIYENKNILESISRAAQEKSKKFIYEGNRKLFLDIFVGEVR